MQTTSDQDLALAYQRAIDVYRADPDDTDALIEAENDICDRLDISPDETEQGLTENAVTMIAEFVERTLA